MKPLRSALIATISVIMLSLIPFFLSSGQCAEVFPNRPITLIINYGAGGQTDIAARLFAAAAEKKLGQPIVVVNKPGAGATLGVTEVARSKPDGYTIGTLPDSPIVITPFLQKVQYEPFKSFDFICGFGRYTYAVFVKANSPFNSIKDVVEAARKNPERSPMHRTPLEFLLRLNIWS